MYDFLIKLKANNFFPSKILDVGANIGEFSIECKKIWKNAEIYLIEANLECKNYLNKISSNCFMEVISNKDNDIVNFYKTKDNKFCTGNSIFLEKSKHYSEDKLIIEKRSTKKLDTLFNIKFDLIKIDVQGAETNVIEGGINTIKNATYVIIETSIKEYNKEARLENEIISIMKNIGFTKFQVIDNHYYPVDGNLYISKGELFQRDLIFYRD